MNSDLNTNILTTDIDYMYLGQCSSSWALLFPLISQVYIVSIFNFCFHSTLLSWDHLMIDALMDNHLIKDILIKEPLSYTFEDHQQHQHQQLKKAKLILYEWWSGYFQIIEINLLFNF